MSAASSLRVRREEENESVKEEGAEVHEEASRTQDAVQEETLLCSGTVPAVVAEGGVGGEGSVSSRSSPPVPPGDRTQEKSDEEGTGAMEELKPDALEERYVSPHSDGKGKRDWNLQTPADLVEDSSEGSEASKEGDSTIREEPGADPSAFPDEAEPGQPPDEEKGEESRPGEAGEKASSLGGSAKEEAEERVPGSVSEERVEEADASADDGSERKGVPQRSCSSSLMEASREEGDQPLDAGVTALAAMALASPEGSADGGGSGAAAEHAASPTFLAFDPELASATKEEKEEKAERQGEASGDGGSAAVRDLLDRKQGVDESIDESDFDF